jgi:transposase-like protein
MANGCLQELVTGSRLGLVEPAPADECTGERDRGVVEVKLLRFGGQPSAWEHWSPQEESTVPRTRPPYPPEFRCRIVELVRADGTPEELAKEFEPSAQTIRTCANQDRVDTGERAGPPQSQLGADPRRVLAVRLRVSACLDSGPGGYG